MRSGKHPYYLSHNPLGALMVLFLLGMLLATIAGWMLTTDAYEAEEWLEDLHGLCANLVMVAVGLHIAAVILSATPPKSAWCPPCGMA